MRLTAALLCLAACSGEEAKDSPAALPALDPPAAGEGFQLSMTGMVVEPYTEVWLCDVYPLPEGAAGDNLTANVNRIEFLQTPDLHHVTISTPGLTPGLIPYGRYNCQDLYSDASLMETMVMMFGGAGDATGEMRLPEGVAAQLPPNLDVIHEVHYVNTTDQPVDLYSWLNGYTLDDAEVVDGIWGGSVRDEYINIPASTTHTEWSRCVFNRDVEVQFLASHSHARGVSFTIAPFDGAATGDIFYENTDWHSPMIVQYDPPLVVPQGQGFEWACTWRNDSDAEVHYGLTADDEMCNLAVVHTPFDVSAECTVVETSDGVLWGG